MLFHSGMDDASQAPEAEGTAAASAGESLVLAPRLRD